MSQPSAQRVRFRGACCARRRADSTGRGGTRFDIGRVNPISDPHHTNEQSVAGYEPWLDKRGLARHLVCSVRWIEARMEEGLPHVHIAGRAKFRISEVEPWLESHGHIERRGEAAAA